MSKQAPGGRARLEGTFYTHRMLWYVLGDLRAQLERDEDSILSLGVASLLVTHTCFEAYLNYAGEILLPNVWADARNAFKREPYRGLMGKLHRLADELAVSIDRGRRPYLTAAQLKTWRDGVTHARIERYERTVTFKDARSLRSPRSQFFRQVTPAFIKCSATDVEALCDVLQAAAHAREPTTFLSPRSFVGIHGMAGGSILRG